MELYTERMTVYIVETSAGDEIVPYDLVSPTYVNREGAMAFEPYCQGRPEDFSIEAGWFSRFSANGFLDCTPWVGPFENEGKAIAECKRIYGDDDE